MRGAVVESCHRVHAVLCRAGGGGPEVFGDPAAAAFWRSALKPYQALPLVEDGAAEAFGYGAEELAVACGSHGGRPEHVERVEAMLRAIGLGVDRLHCGPHVPYDDEAAIAMRCAGDRPGPIHNNCSGKHAAMLALALHHGWDPDGYWRFEHPVQRRIRERLSDWIDAVPDELRWETDGCGLPTPWISLRDMALAYARLARGSAAGDAGPAAVVSAMTRHPELTSSPEREPLRLMRATAGRVLAKEGAEGVLCAAAVGEGWGLALKVEDGARRAVGPAAVTILATAGLLAVAEQEALAALAEPAILSTRGERIGTVRALSGAAAEASAEARADAAAGTPGSD